MSELRYFGHSEPHGRFAHYSESVWGPLDVTVLNACWKLSTSLHDHPSNPATSEAANESLTKVVGFVDELDAYMRDCVDETSRVKLENALLTPVGQGALHNCEAQHVAPETAMMLVKLAPRAVCKSRHLLSNISDYSFLTPEQAKILFRREHEPFMRSTVVNTLQPMALLELLRVCFFDLSQYEATILMPRLCTDQELKDVLASEGQVYLIWSMATLNQQYVKWPVEWLEEEICSQEDVSGDLLQMLLVWTVYTENVVCSTMAQIASLHPGRQNRDQYHTKSTDDDGVWNEYRKITASGVSIIEDVMQCRAVIIDALMRKRSRTDGTNREAIVDLLVLLQTPLSLVARKACFKMRDASVLAFLDANPHIIGLCRESMPHHNPCIMLLTWKRMADALPVPLVYDQQVTEGDDGAASLAERWFRLARRASGDLTHSHWSRLFMYQVIHSEHDERNFERLGDWMLEVLSGEWAFQQRLFPNDEKMVEFLRPQFAAMKRFRGGYSEHSVLLEQFRKSPDELTRADIRKLQADPELMRAVDDCRGNIAKLHTLTGFTVEDLTGPRVNLAQCEALHTLDMATLAEIVKRRGFAFDDPNRILWSVHPRLFNIPEFRDWAWELVTFDTLVSYPERAKELRLTEMMLDVRGRIERLILKQSGGIFDVNAIAPLSPLKEVQRVIIKWAIMREFNYIECQMMMRRKDSFAVKGIHEAYAEQEEMAHLNLLRLLKPLPVAVTADGKRVASEPDVLCVLMKSGALRELMKSGALRELMKSGVLRELVLLDGRRVLVTSDGQCVMRNSDMLRALAKSRMFHTVSQPDVLRMVSQLPLSQLSVRTRCLNGLRGVIGFDNRRIKVLEEKLRTKVMKSSILKNISEQLRDITKEQKDAARRNASYSELCLSNLIERPLKYFVEKTTAYQHQTLQLLNEYFKDEPEYTLYVQRLHIVSLVGITISTLTEDAEQRLQMIFQSGPIQARERSVLRGIFELFKLSDAEIDRILDTGVLTLSQEAVKLMHDETKRLTKKVDELQKKAKEQLARVKELSAL